MPEWQRRHLTRLDSSHRYPHSEIYFVTVVARGRRPILTTPQLAGESVGALATASSSRGWAVGRYVMMPDHIHFFCSPGDEATTLQEFIGAWKSWTNRRARELDLCDRLWQHEFFDHLIRSNESYDEKWNYVRNNPVRAGLCNRAEAWPWQGEIVVLDDP